MQGRFSSREKVERAINRVLPRAVFSIARQGDDRDLGEQ